MSKFADDNCEGIFSVHVLIGLRFRQQFNDQEVRHTTSLLKHNILARIRYQPRFDCVVF